jgi:hypothetical protein
MKNTILTLSLIIATLTGARSFADQIKFGILDWDQDVPVSPEQIMEQIQTDAGYLSYETDDRTCGGQVQETRLVEHNKARNADGVIVHQLLIQFTVTKALRYCASEALLTCEAPFELTSAEDVVMGHWDCAR